MSLGKKTILLFLVLGIGFCAGSYAVLNIAVMPVFEDFERNATEESMNRVGGILQSEIRALEIMNVEYSAWTPTYLFAKGENPGYVEENLSPDYWHSVDIELMLLLDIDGSELYSHFADSYDGPTFSFRDALYRPLDKNHPLVTFAGTTSSVKGLLNTRKGVMQVVSYPILSSDAKGPIEGALVVGQLLSAEHMQDLGHQSSTDLRLYSVLDADMPDRIRNTFKSLTGTDDDRQIIVGKDTVSGLRLLFDIFGAPVAVLEVAEPREIYQIGKTVIRSTMVALAIATVIFMLSALVFLQRLITSPISRLTDKILYIQDSGDLSVDIQSDRKDEVGVLANEFGQLARQLNAIRSDLEAARDEAIAMSNAKSEFLARMSHEIRTPMNGVLGMTELLRGTQLDDRQRRFAKTIYESGEALLHIINDILDIAKIESGKVELDSSHFNLRSVVEECLDLLAESAHSKKLELIGDIDGDDEIPVEGDPVRLRQVLMNLVGNAIKFTERGQVVVQLREVPAGDGCSDFKFDVIDTGIGIKADNVVHIFEPFSQEDGSNTRRYGGTGLGLSISRQLVELMGGSIEVHSKPGAGSIFSFTLRLPVGRVDQPAAHANRLTGKRVFVVDDNATNVDIVRHHLESWHMQVDTACSGEHALQLLRDSQVSPFDIMLLDVAMPGMNGVTLAKEIRREAVHKNTPLVMLSSISRADAGHDESTNGPEAWIAKPLRKSQLRDTLEALVRDESQPAATRLAQAVNDEVYDAPGGGLEVLVVDDNEVNLSVAKAMLDTLSHRATLARSGMEALALFKSRAFDVVLMDCRMPEMDGFETTRAMIEVRQEAALPPVPIVAVTAHALTGDREKCLAAGMSDYLSKPFTREQLEKIIDDNAQKPASSVLHRQSTALKRVLIVDDNVVNQSVTREMLAALGYESESVDDGNHAIEILKQQHFDLVLMDCNMPIRDGFGTTIKIREREMRSGLLTRIPIIALTANVMERDRERCFDAGMDDYLTKPITQAQLKDVLERWLAGGTANARAPIPADNYDNRRAVAMQSIDLAALQEIQQLDQTSGSLVLREIIVSYCASSTKIVLQLRSAVDDKEYDVVEHLAHSLKGGSSQLGAALLASLCDKMVDSVEAGDEAALKDDFERIAVEHSEVLAGLESALQTLAA